MPAVHLSILDSIRIASPCSMRWEQMTPVGDGVTTRHCGQCKLNVHNLSAMSAAEAESFLATQAHAPRTCAAVFRRSDGTILTRDCPVGLRRARQRLVRGISRAAAAIVFVLGGFAIARSRQGPVSLPGLARTQPFATLCDWTRPPLAQQPPVYDEVGRIDLQTVLQQQQSGGVQ